MSSAGALPPLSGGSEGSIGDHAKFGVLTVSDRAHNKVYDDLSGPAILNFFHDAVESSWEAVYQVVPDEQPMIEAALIDMVDRQGCCLVVTTGMHESRSRQVGAQPPRALLLQGAPDPLHGTSPRKRRRRSAAA
jgi:molybdopterin adenylyltransferase